jgi:hypothetical protein
MTTERLPEHPDYATYLSAADQEEADARTLELAIKLFFESRPIFGYWGKLTVRTQRMWLEKARNHESMPNRVVPAEDRGPTAKASTEESEAPAIGHEYTRMAVAAGDTFRAEDVKDLLSHLDIAAERAKAAETKLKRVRELFEDHRHLLPGDLCAALDGAIYPPPILRSPEERMETDMRIHEIRRDNHPSLSTLNPDGGKR